MTDHPGPFPVPDDIGKLSDRMVWVYLWAAGPSTSTEISDGTGMPSSTVSNATRRLEDAGHTERRPIPLEPRTYVSFPGFGPNQQDPQEYFGSDLAKGASGSSEESANRGTSR